MVRMGSFLRLRQPLHLDQGYTLMLGQDYCGTIGFGLRWEGAMGQFPILSGGSLFGGRTTSRTLYIIEVSSSSLDFYLQCIVETIEKTAKSNAQNEFHNLLITEVLSQGVKNLF